MTSSSFNHEWVDRRGLFEMNPARFQGPELLSSSWVSGMPQPRMSHGKRGFEEREL
jgi:hypothetical protein